ARHSDDGELRRASGERDSRARPRLEFCGEPGVDSVADRVHRANQPARPAGDTVSPGSEVPRETSLRPLQRWKLERYSASQLDVRDEVADTDVDPAGSLDQAR